jgi:hypothetical protein
MMPSNTVAQPWGSHWDSLFTWARVAGVPHYDHDSHPLEYYALESTSFFLAALH